MPTRLDKVYIVVEEDYIPGRYTYISQAFITETEARKFIDYMTDPEDCMQPNYKVIERNIYYNK